MKQWLAAAALAPALYFGGVDPAAAQTSIAAYTGEVRLFAFNFCPAGWLQANGQVLNITSYVQLFSLLGTAYGGNGQTTFALPNLTGRAPIGFGQSPPGGNYSFATVYGQSLSPGSPGSALAMNWCIAYQSTYPTRQ